MREAGSHFDELLRVIDARTLEGGNLEGDRLTFPYDSARAPDGHSFVAVYLDANPDAGTELVALDGINEIRGAGLVGVTFDGTTLDGGMYRAKIESYGTDTGISTATVKDDWSLAKAWLYREMAET